MLLACPARGGRGDDAVFVDGGDGGVVLGQETEDQWGGTGGEEVENR